MGALLKTHKSARRARVLLNCLFLTGFARLIERQNKSFCMSWFRVLSGFDAFYSKKWCINSDVLRSGIAPNPKIFPLAPSALAGPPLCLSCEWPILGGFYGNRFASLFVVF